MNNLFYSHTAFLDLQTENKTLRHAAIGRTSGALGSEYWWNRAYLYASSRSCHIAVCTTKTLKVRLATRFYCLRKVVLA